MLEIICPWCGVRSETEFTCGGEAGIVRPHAPEGLSDEQWGDYVFMRKNSLGLHDEQWRHSSGCGRWFNLRRNTLTYRFSASWLVGESPPPPGTSTRTGEKNE